jgi:hypothetical protein
MTVVSGAVASGLFAGGAPAAARDPLVIPGIGPISWADRNPAYFGPSYAPSARSVRRRAHSPYWAEGVRPRPVRAAFAAPRRFHGWAPPNPYDDEYRPAAYNGADPFPPPPRPYRLRSIPPFCVGYCAW